MTGLLSALVCMAIGAVIDASVRDYLRRRREAKRRKGGL